MATCSMGTGKECSLDMLKSCFFKAVKFHSCYFGQGERVSGSIYRLVE